MQWESLSTRTSVSIPNDVLAVSLLWPVAIAEIYPTVFVAVVVGFAYRKFELRNMLIWRPFLKELAASRFFSRWRLDEWLLRSFLVGGVWASSRGVNLNRYFLLNSLASLWRRS